MKAWQIDSYGGSPALVFADRGVASAGKVVIEVAGAAINPLDLKIRAGQMHDYFPVQFPYTPGTDVSGTIVEVGDAVAGWSVGDQVVARLDPSLGGALAEFAVVPAGELVRAPRTVPLALASGAVTAAATAWQALKQIADVGPGDRVLVHGGAGGVGSFAVQFAHRLGAHVVATASDSGLDIAIKLGADEVIDYTTTQFESRVSKIDVVIDTVGGQVEERSLDVLRPEGLLVATPVPPDAERAASRGRRAEFVFHNSDADRLSTVVELVDDGVVILLDRLVPIDEGDEALSYLAAGHARGKVVVVP